MYHVKLSIANDNAGCGRQTPSGKKIWGNYCFHINEDIPEADFWVVYSKGQRKTETCKCAPENTIFVTGEPETVYHYSKGFVNQFAIALSVQPKIKHPRLMMMQPAQPWHIGKVTNRKDGVITSVEYTRDYDALKLEIPKKSKLISIISSNKCFTQGHKDRLKFAMALKEHYGDKLDLFGQGLKPFADKWEVVAPYKYHICIENSAYPHYWTEKLADCYLGMAYPFYFGAPNVGKYFNDKAFTPIDIHDIEASIKIIDEAVADNLYEERLPYIAEAKNLVLDRYNLFAMLSDVMDTMDADAAKRELTIKSDTSFLDLKKVKIMVLDRIMHKLKK